MSDNKPSPSVYAWGQPEDPKRGGYIYWWDKPRLQDRIDWLKSQIKATKKWLKQFEIMHSGPYAHTEYEQEQEQEQKQFELTHLEEGLAETQKLWEMPLPDRELTIEEKMNLYWGIENALREPCSIIDQRVDFGSGVADTEIGRRMQAVRAEMSAILDLILPPAAKDETRRPDAGSSWDTFRTPARVWRANVTRRCRGCGSICDVHEYIWDKTSDELIAEDDAKNARIREAVAQEEAAKKAAEQPGSCHGVACAARISM